MLKMNAGIWIGIVGGIVGMLIAIISVIYSVPGGTSLYVVAGVILLCCGISYLFYKLIFGPMFNAARLHKSGISARALIKEVHDTNITVNNSPQVKLVLQLKNSFGQSYETTCRVLVSRINPGAYQPGMEIPVKVDPKNEKNVVVDFSPGAAMGHTGSNGQPNMAELQAELEKTEADNQLLRSTGREARAIVKNYTWLGIFVNGNNPYVELEVEVIPADAPAFSGKAKCVISETSTIKYQPGKEVYVKYDLYDNSKVAIDRGA